MTDPEETLRVSLHDPALDDGISADALLARVRTRQGVLRRRRQHLATAAAAAVAVLVVGGVAIATARPPAVQPAGPPPAEAPPFVGEPSTVSPRPTTPPTAEPTQTSASVAPPASVPTPGDPGQENNRRTVAPAPSETNARPLSSVRTPPTVANSPETAPPPPTRR